MACSILITLHVRRGILYRRCLWSAHASYNRTRAFRAHTPCCSCGHNYFISACMSGDHAFTQSQEFAYRFLFCGFNFRGLPINRENRENWTPQKFPAYSINPRHACAGRVMVVCVCVCKCVSVCTAVNKMRYVL